MHEASLVQGLLNIVLKAVQDWPDPAPLKVREIVCEAGLLACFEENTLRACFRLFAEGTAAENATLTINTAPLACACDDCGHKFELLTRRFVCPSCGKESISFRGGQGLVIQAINVDCEEGSHD